MSVSAHPPGSSHSERSASACTRLSLEDVDPANRVTAFCIGDIWLGVDKILRGANSTESESNRDYFENVILYATEDFYIHCQCIERSGAPFQPRGPSDTEHDKNLARQDLLRAVILAPADPVKIVSLCATASRNHRAVSELVALDTAGTVTLFEGIHVRRSCVILGVR